MCINNCLLNGKKNILRSGKLIDEGDKCMMSAKNCHLYTLIVGINPLIANIPKWSNTLKQSVGKLPMNCLSVIDHFVGLALKELRSALPNANLTF